MLPWVVVQGWHHRGSDTLQVFYSLVPVISESRSSLLDYFQMKLVLVFTRPDKEQARLIDFISC
jgi:hypothetical protein